MHPKKINSEKMKESLDRLFSIYKDISSNADEVMKIDAHIKMQSLDVLLFLNVRIRSL